MDTTQTLHSILVYTSISAINNNISNVMKDAVIEFNNHLGKDTVYIKHVPEISLTTGEGLPLDKFIVLYNLDDAPKSCQGIWVPLTHSYFTGVVVKITWDTDLQPSGFWLTYITNDGTICSFSKVCDISPFINHPMDVLITYLTLNDALRYVRETVVDQLHVQGKLYGIAKGTGTGLWELVSPDDDVHRPHEDIVVIKQLKDTLAERDKTIENLRAKLHEQCDEFLETRHTVKLHEQNVEFLDSKINELREIIQQQRVEQDKSKSIISSQRGKLKELQRNERNSKSFVSDTPVLGHRAAAETEYKQVNNEIIRLTIKLAGLGFDSRLSKEEIGKRQKKLIKKLHELRHDIHS